MGYLLPTLLRPRIRSQPEFPLAPGGWSLTLILQFIAAHLGFLWQGARFRIVGSEVAMYNGGDACLLVESDVLRLRFVCDRRQLLLDFQPSGNGMSSDWFSVDLIRRLLIGEPETDGRLNAGYAAFIREHLAEIEDRFRDSNWPTTHAELKLLKTKRAKGLFG